MDARRIAMLRFSITVALLSCIASASTGAPAPAADEGVPAFKQLDSMEARVQGCVTCHEQDGQGTGSGAFPRIAGKPAGYLFNQLVAFRDGTRSYPPMNYLLAFLPDAYLHAIAAYFAARRPPFAAREQANVDAATLARGRSLVTQGDVERGVPPCVACHGNGLTGMDPGIPGLAGLRASYIEAQLTRWRVGERHAAEPDCMKRIATRLSDRDVGEVAAWLARQEPPKDASPESRNLVRMPLACGSQR